MGITEEQPDLTSTKEIAEHYERCSDHLEEVIRTQWRDADLQKK